MEFVYFVFFPQQYSGKIHLHYCRLSLKVHLWVSHNIFIILPLMDIRFIYSLSML